MTRIKNDGEMSTEVLGRTPGRIGLILLGIILVLAFFLPVLEREYSRRSFYRNDPPEYKLKFVNIEMLSSDERLPTIARFMAIYPVIAGVVILIVAAVAPNIVRGAVVTGLGIILYLALLIGGDAQRAINLLPRGTGAIVLIYFLVSLGLTGLLAGSLARRYRPKSNFAVIIGIVGGVLFLGGLLLPVLPKDAGTVLLAMPFKLFDAGKDMARAVGTLILLAMVCWIIASILCFANIPRRSTRSAKVISVAASWSFFIGGVLLFIAILIPVCANNSDASQLGANLLILAKITTWVLGGFLILPLGLVGLTVAMQDLFVGVVKVAQPAAPSLDNRLIELQRLHEQDVITQEEYEKQRSKIISSL